MFGVSETVSIDGDDPHHLDWIYQRSLERADEFRITGVTYRLAQGLSYLQTLLKSRNSKENPSIFSYCALKYIHFQIPLHLFHINCVRFMHQIQMCHRLI